MSSKELKPQWIDIAEIKSNTENAKVRRSLPVLYGMGYGIVTKPEKSDKPTLIEMALSEDPEQRANFCHLIETYECSDDPNYVPLTDDDGKKDKRPKGSIVALAASIVGIGWQQPGKVRPRAEEDGGGYDLVFGARRLVSALYNYCKSGGKMAPRVWAFVEELAEDSDALHRAFAENGFRKDMTPMEMGRFVDMQIKGGKKYNEIAAETGVDHQTLRGRHRLMKLKKEEQEKVHTGEIPYTRAIKILDSRKKGTPEPRAGRGATGNNDRLTVPKIADYKNWYGTGKAEPREDLKEAVREFIALEILKTEYKTLAQIKKDRTAAAAAPASTEAAANAAS